MRLLDLFCGAGGAAEGYRRAGFTEIIGVDHRPQPRYPFTFIQGDATKFLCSFVGGSIDGFPECCDRCGRAYDHPGHWRYDALHASPPCQAHTDLQRQNKRIYADHIAQIRGQFQQTGLPYVIENVEGAPLFFPLLLCGTMFSGLRVLRHRLFESNLPLVAPAHPAHPLVFTHDKRKAHYGQLDQTTAFVQVTGGGNATVTNKRAAMGIDWMTGTEINQAIPPAYTEHIGRQLLAHLQQQAVA